jgi:hypothetical protein
MSGGGGCALSQLMEDTLPELLKYHVVAGTSALVAGPLDSLQGRSLDVTVDGALKVRRLLSLPLSLAPSLAPPHCDVGGSAQCT